MRKEHGNSIIMGTFGGRMDTCQPDIEHGINYSYWSVRCRITGPVWQEIMSLQRFCPHMANCVYISSDSALF